MRPGHLALESAPLALLLQTEWPWEWALKHIALVEGLGNWSEPAVSSSPDTFISWYVLAGFRFQEGSYIGALVCPGR